MEQAEVFCIHQELSCEGVESEVGDEGKLEHICNIIGINTSQFQLRRHIRITWGIEIKKNTDA